MLVIDTKMDLTIDHLKKLLECNPKTVTIEIVHNGDEANKKVITQTVEEFKKFDFGPAEEDDVMRFISDEVTLLLKGYDYNWWNANTRRKNRLAKGFADMTPSNIVVEQPITIAIANLTENGLEMMKIKTGIKKEIIDFMNAELKERLIGSNFEAFVVFKFNYVDDDKLHPETWFTIEELAEKGVLTLR